MMPRPPGAVPLCCPRPAEMSAPPQVRPRTPPPPPARSHPPRCRSYSEPASLPWTGLKDMRMNGGMN